MDGVEKTALVTGASRGIGRAIALALAKEGYAVAVNYAGSREAAEAVRDEITAAGGQAFILQGDVSSAEDVDRIFKTIKEEFGFLDVLVNNAGITRDSLLVRMKENQWDEVIDTDLKSNFLTVKAAGAMMMRRKKGAIINIASFQVLSEIWDSLITRQPRRGLSGLPRQQQENWHRGVSGSMLSHRALS